MPRCFAQCVEGAVQVGLEQLVVHLAAHVRERGCARREARVREYAIDAAHGFNRRVETASYLSLIGDIHDFRVSSFCTDLRQLFHCLCVTVCSTAPYHDIGALPGATHKKAKTDATVGTGREHHASNEIE